MPDNETILGTIRRLDDKPLKSSKHVLQLWKYWLFYDCFHCQISKTLWHCDYFIYWETLQQWLCYKDWNTFYMCVSHPQDILSIPSIMTCDLTASFTVALSTLPPSSQTNNAIKISSDIFYCYNPKHNIAITPWCVDDKSCAKYISHSIHYG